MGRAIWVAFFLLDSGIRVGREDCMLMDEWIGIRVDEWDRGG